MKKIHKFYFCIITNSYNSLLSANNSKEEINLSENKKYQNIGEITPFKKKIIDEIYLGNNKIFINYDFSFDLQIKIYLLIVILIHFFITELNSDSDKVYIFNNYLHINLLIDLLIYYFYFRESQYDNSDLKMLIFNYIKKITTLIFISYLKTNIVKFVYLHFNLSEETKEFEEILLKHNHYICTYFYLFIIFIEIFRDYMKYYINISKIRNIRRILKENSINENNQIIYYNNPQTNKILDLLTF
jgi:hypothetical protein